MQRVAKKSQAGKLLWIAAYQVGLLKGKRGGRFAKRPKRRNRGSIQLAAGSSFTLPVKPREKNGVTASPKRQIRMPAVSTRLA
jgi:hypothetical protein